MKKLTKEQIENIMQIINDLYFTDKLITIKGNTSTLHGDNLRTALESLGEEENIVPPPEPNSKRNWEEDYQYENGNYLNECTYCYKPFLGIKNRTCCKVCYERI